MRQYRCRIAAVSVGAGLYSGETIQVCYAGMALYRCNAALVCDCVGVQVGKCVTLQMWDPHGMGVNRCRS